ncbi:MAG: hypothetical protein ACR2Q4_07480 [Geminicoccaceae bacterium]
MTTMAKSRRGRTGRSKSAVDGQGRAHARSTHCPACAAPVQDDARYCQGCGRSLQGSGWLSPQTLAVLAAAGIAIVTLGFLFASVIEVDDRASSTRTAAALPSATSSGQPPDLSTMTPREAADRLFNRVMTAHEQGDSEQVEQFAPMALSAYEMIENPDTDALFHMGLIQAAAGQLDEAASSAERLKAVVPNHLLATLLEHRLAEQAGDQAAAQRAVMRFEDNYDEEIAVDRPEYLHHRSLIEGFRADG